MEMTFSFYISIGVSIEPVVVKMVWMERPCRGRQVTGETLMTLRGKCCYCRCWCYYYKTAPIKLVLTSRGLNYLFSIGRHQNGNFGVCCIAIRSKITSELMEAALTQVICKQAPLLSNPVNIFNLSI